MKQFETRSRLDFPSAREAPPEIVRQLRDIDPTAELLWFRRGVWALGTVKPNTIRRGLAEGSAHILNGAAAAIGKHIRDRQTLKKAAISWGDKMALTKLRLQGFVEQASYALKDDELGVLVRWFREAKYVQQHAYEATMRQWERQAEEDPESEQKAKDLTDRSRLRAAWRMGFKNPVSILSPGIPGKKVFTNDGVQSQCALTHTPTTAPWSKVS